LEGYQEALPMVDPLDEGVRTIPVGVEMSAKGALVINTIPESVANASLRLIVGNLWSKAFQIAQEARTSRFLDARRSVTPISIPLKSPTNKILQAPFFN
jgi:hypothetical protein